MFAVISVFYCIFCLYLSGFSICHDLLFYFFVSGVFFFFQAEDGIRDLVRSRGLGDVYKRQALYHAIFSSQNRPNDKCQDRNADDRRHENTSNLIDQLLNLSLIHI